MAGALDSSLTRLTQSNPPGSWHPARRLLRHALAPVERFLAIEAASGLLLLGAAAIALAWANSPWRDAYAALWHLPVGLKFGSFSFERDLHFWINDGVMTVFFFVVGLEIRREIHRGELSELRRAALPLTAAVGGMVVPALLYLAFNWSHPSRTGWGIPMATDIAFALGVLMLLGRRVPPALRVLLLALAVIDDLGAILVIAFFYSSGIAPAGLVTLGLGLGLIVVMQLFGVRSPWAYVPPAVTAWAGAYAAGVHPTLAGVAVGLMTPVRPWFRREDFVEQAHEGVAALRSQGTEDERGLAQRIQVIGEMGREAVSPVERIQHALHGWVAFGAMPLFAFANAGVSLGDASFEGEPIRVLFGIAVGLVLGKPIGVIAASWLATRLGFAALPRGVTWAHVTVVGLVSGIGFTMSIFIAGLAFPAGENLETSKVGILLASGGAAVVAFALGRIMLPSHLPEGAAATAAEAESATEA